MARRSPFDRVRFAWWPELTAFAFWLCLPLLRLLGLARFPATGAWVVGGHAGRLYADNAAALHEYVATQSDQAAIWLTANSESLAELRARGMPALRRNSYAARLAIVNAEAIIFSHGQSDLDTGLLRYYRPRGRRFCLGHGLNLLKAGQMLRPGALALAAGARRRLERQLTNFDHWLTISELERGFFRRSLPNAGVRLGLGGGAHVDAFLRARTLPASRTIVYFPTWREAAGSQARLDATCRRLAADAELAAWLERTGRELVIIAHINQAARGGWDWAPGAQARLPKGGDQPGQGTQSARVSWLPPSRLLECVLSAELLVTDYSSIAFDYLALRRPIVLFPFDLEEYLVGRTLYVDYDEIGLGPRVDGYGELVELLTSERWQDTAPYQEARERWLGGLFDTLEPVYAERSYREVCRLLAQPPPEA